MYIRSVLGMYLNSETDRHKQDWRSIANPSKSCQNNLAMFTFEESKQKD